MKNSLCSNLLKVLNLQRSIARIVSKINHIWRETLLSWPWLYLNSTVGRLPKIYLINFFRNFPTFSNLLWPVNWILKTVQHEETFFSVVHSWIWIWCNATLLASKTLYLEYFDHQWKVIDKKIQSCKLWILKWWISKEFTIFKKLIITYNWTEMEFQIFLISYEV